MIVRKDKSFLKCSDYPNTDWIGNADWVLDDNDSTDAEIEKKIVSMYPNFDFVLDDDGNISNVVFSEPIITEEQINARKNERIQESKTLLAKWLNDNPFLYTDGKYYSCTEEKQSLLNSNLASYERATNAGIVYTLKWNSTGEECTDWTYEDLLTLSLSIAAYVAPKVSRQQSIEIQIKECSTLEQINAITISYD